MSDISKLLLDLLAAKVPEKLIKDVLNAIVDAENGFGSSGHPRGAEYRRQVPLEIWEEFRRQVFERDGPNCMYCGTDVDSTFNCDHVIPTSRGGKTELSNLTVACKSCNSSKKNRLVSEWRGRSCQ